MQASPLTIAIGCFAAGSLAAVGIAQATSPAKIPDSNTGVITSCVKKKGGQVRFVDAQAGKKCKKSERKVTFNQTGQQGAQGTPGTTGAQGERGPSNAFVKTSSASKDITEPSIAVPAPPVDNRIVTLDLEPGKYVVTAHTSAAATDGVTVSITCSLTGPASTVEDSSQPWTVSAQDARQPFAVTGTYSNTAAGSVSLICVPRDSALITSSGDGTAFGGTITATKVADLTVQ